MFIVIFNLNIKNLRFKNLSGFKDAKIFAVRTLCSIMKGVKTKGLVKLSGFGTFRKARINGREYKNPQNPKQSIFREAHDTVRFRA